MSKSIQELEAIIKKANDDYYNLGNSSLSDAEYDSYVEELRLLDPNNSLLKNVGDNPSNSNKVKLPIKMGSLNKIRPDTQKELQKLLSYNNEIILMPKYDGLSVLLEYSESGDFVKMMTRGDGTYGQDVTARAYCMNFPKKINHKGSKFYIIGEAICSKKVFEALKDKTSYKVARNFVGGILRPILSNDDYQNLDSSVHKLCSYIDIVPYDIISNSSNNATYNKILDLLYKIGFIRVPYKILTTLKDVSEESLISNIKKVKSEYVYDTDGIVLKVNSKSIYNKLGKESNGLNPKGGRAVKLNVMDQYSQVGVIKDIEWSITKRGIFAPVVVLERPLNFSGAEISRVSGVNVSYVKELGLGIGAKVGVIKSGDVIPRIISTIERKEYDFSKLEKCPYCGSKLENNGVNLYCPNKNCEGIKKEIVINFFLTLNLDSVSYKTLEDLYDNGFNTVEKLLNIKYSNILKLSGYQAKKALNAEKQLNNCLKNITLAKVMYATNLFSSETSSLGETKLQLFIDYLGEDNLLNKLNNETDDVIKVISNANIEGIGPEGKKLFLENYNDFKSFFSSIKDFITFKKNEVVGDKLKGKIFTFTNFRDKELEKLIIENGGEVKPMSKKTTTLFAAGDSNKTLLAEKYGIKIIPAADASFYINKLLNS